MASKAMSLRTFSLKFPAGLERFSSFAEDIDRLFVGEDSLDWKWDSLKLGFHAFQV